MSKTRRPTWFKMFLHQKAIVESVEDETAGKALKAVFQYFDTGEIAELDQMTFLVFSAIKPYIDESFADFQEASEKNRANIQKRWANRVIPNDTTRTTGIKKYHSIPNIPNDTKNTEAEAEAETEAETEAEDRADKPPTRPRFSSPSADDVRAYCMEQGYTAVDPQRFVDYYTSNGWMVGKSKMKDWKAAVRGWNSREQEKAPKKPMLFPDVPTL